MNPSPVGLLAAGLLSTPVLAQTFHFDKDVVGAVPARWTCGVTGRGSPRWSVVAYASAPSPQGAHAVGQRQLPVTLDGRRLIEVDDTHLSGAGAVGVWTKADSVTAFDDFAYGAVRP